MPPPPDPARPANPPPRVDAPPAVVRDGPAAAAGVFQTVLDGLPQRVFWKGPDLRYLGCNAAFAADAGVGDPANIVGKSDLELPWPDDQTEHFRADDRRIVSGEEPELTVVEPMDTAGGVQNWLETRKVPLRDAAGSLAGVLGTYCDVTARETAARAAKRAKERLELALDGSGAGLWDWNVATDAAYFSDAWYRMIGCRREEMDPTGAAFLALIHADDRAAVREAIDRHFADESTVYEATFRMARAGGGWVWVRARGRVVDRDAHGAPLRMTGLHADVTGEKELQAQLARQAESLRHKHRMEAVGSLAGGVAHEFNNLLQAIGGYAGFAADTAAELPDGLGDSIREDLAQVAVAADRAAELTRQLLDFSRKETAERATLDAADELDSLVKLLRPLVGERVELRVEAPPRAGLVRADRTELQQALLNLCLNARDAMPDGGALTLSVGPAPKAGGGEVVVGEDSAGPRVRFAVADTGGGVPDGVRDRIFDPFFTTKPPGKGTGMGLAAVYSTAEHHGGRVTLATGPGGSTFGLELPACDAAGPAAFAPPDPAPGAGAGPAPRVLLAEDEPLVREVAVRTLRRGGFDPVAVARGDEAVAAFESDPGGFDVLLFDMVMPGLTGREAYDRIRTDRTEQGRPAPPVLFCTGYDPESDAAVQQCAGLPQVRKPLPPAELLAAVRDVLAAGPPDAAPAGAAPPPAGNFDDLFSVGVA